MPPLEEASNSSPDLPLAQRISRVSSLLPALSAGHTDSHAWHPTQAPASITGLRKPNSSSCMEMHDLGHLAAHAPQPQQASPSLDIFISS